MSLFFFKTVIFYAGFMTISFSEVLISNVQNKSLQLQVLNGIREVSDRLVALCHFSRGTDRSWDESSL